MADWQEVLAPYIRSIEKRYDSLKYRLYDALGGPGPIKILAYRGYGTPERLFLKGRVLEDRDIGRATEADSLWENLLNMYKRMASREIPYARVRVRFQGQMHEIEADDEGMFETWIEPGEPLTGDQLWHEVALELIEPPAEEQEEPVRATARVLVPPPSAEYGVVSDVDDTLLQSNAANLLRMARTVFFENAHTRLPFAGAAAFYQALHNGSQDRGPNPLFFVSNSPWNLYDLLSQFFQLQDIPSGPLLFLRNGGVYEDELLPTDHVKHKLPVIRQILGLYDEMPFILIGDSTESDPEIYYRLVKQYPGRILAIYIRNVGRNPNRSEAIQRLAERVVDAGSVLVLADDSLSMAQHAVHHGWIVPQALRAVRRDKVKDEGPPGEFEQLLQ